MWVTFSSELHNWPEVKGTLLARGHRLRGNCDVEMLLHLYEEHGDRVVEQTRGMSAFALYDRARRRRLPARDCVGKTPLCYHDDGRRIVFASELKALLLDSSVPGAVDERSLADYLTFQYVPSTCWSSSAACPSSTSCAATSPSGSSRRWRAISCRPRRWRAANRGSACRSSAGWAPISAGWRARCGSTGVRAGAAGSTPPASSRSCTARARATSGRADQVWSLVRLELWAQTYLDRPGDRITEPPEASIPARVGGWSLTR